MRTSFNVLDDPWIPVVEADGRKALLGIRETLRRAQELKEISTTSPLEEFCVYRFLSVFLMDALRPKRITSLTELLKKGCFCMEQIESYIALCKGEGVTFDLFDEKRPFLQSAYVQQWDKEPKPVSNLDCFLPSGNNHLHFEHKRAEEYAIPVERAARLLLVVQQFCAAEGRGYSYGINGLPPYFGVVKAGNLFETLVYTLIPVRSIEIPLDDPPVIWRSTEPVGSKKEVGQTSWLRGMQFPARRVQLQLPDENGLVSKVYLSQGENFVNKDSWTDPFVTYRTLETGRAPLRPKGDKPIWRSMHDIIGINGNRASQLLTQYVRLSDALYVDVTLYGVETSQASYLDVVRKDVRFRADITECDEAIKLLKRSVEAAEHLARRLGHCMHDDNVIPQMVIDDAVNRYYAQSEALFWHLCETCSHDPEQIGEQYRQWCDAIGGYAKSAFEQALKQVQLRGKALAIAAKQQKRLAAEIIKIREDENV